MPPRPVADIHPSRGRSWLVVPAVAFTLKIILAVSSILITYALADIAYRIHRYEKTTSLRTPFFTIDTPLYVFDADLGYRYRHGSTVRFTHLDADNNVLQVATVRVNNLGHVSPADDTLAKPPGEFRIAILGDSFTASVHNNIPWPSLLQDLLDSDRDLKRQIGVSSVKVINFGMDGTGLVQFARIYEHEVRRYEPDLLIVNFISRDIPRRFIWRATIERDAASRYQLTLTCASLPTALDNSDCALFYGIVLDPVVLNDKDELSRVKHEIGRRVASRTRWVSFHPELLVKLGQPLGLSVTSKLDGPFQPAYETEAEAVGASLEALRGMKASHSRLLVTHNPTYDEILSGRMPGYVLDLMKKGASLRVVPMAGRLGAADKTEVLRWFNPHDRHFSNYGAAVYARAISATVREYLTAR